MEIVVEGNRNLGCGSDRMRKIEVQRGREIEEQDVVYVLVLVIVRGVPQAFAIR